jgi:CO/xanthine dehydrogenase FAD-binding subunit
MSILKDFKFHSPGKLSEALSLLEKAKTPMLLAGGTFALNYLKKSSKYPSDVISLKKIDALHGIKPKGQGFWIGATTTIAELADSELIKSGFPSLFEASAKLGTTPIRNMATIGGNIASRFYWVDLPAVLLSLGACVTVATKKKKETVALEKFLSDKQLKKYILTGILLPKENRLSFYFRHTRTAQEVDVPSLGVAFSGIKRGEGVVSVRCIVNTASSLPVALRNVETLFEGSQLKKISAGELKKAILEDVQNTKLDEYRVHLLFADLEKLLDLL